MNSVKPAPISPDWLSKTLAGLVLGFVLALGCTGLFNTLADDMPLTIRGQLAMWLMAPLWMGALAGVYFFRNGKRAWAWLTGTNLLVFGILAMSRLG